MTEPLPLLSIIIVHYNTPNLLLGCIESILQDHYDGGIEILVVDNGGLTPNVIEKLKKLTEVKCVDAGYNAGFARANNIGIRLARGKYLLLINPDSSIGPGFLKTLVANYRLHENKEKLGLMGCRIVDPENGQVFEYGSGIGFYGLKNILRQNPLHIWAFRKRCAKETYTAKQRHYVNHLVDFVSGACVMVNKEVLLKEGLYLDEDFFLYYEDMEWSFRWKRRGFNNRLCGETEIAHVNSASTSRFSNKSAQIRISQYLFLMKTQSRTLYFLGGVLHWINFKLNLFLTKKKQPKRHKELVYEKKLFSNYYFQIMRGSKPSKGKYLNYVAEEA
ncbi:MAG TPA: hypothetical protein DCF84_00460 [Bacteroidetes bacterium]|nr:hypothetical protein [Bacteroidota bacterium]|tara:strand:+ start:660 stop:1655 length:996 start_codon:yes stop_codon:yes gene_type:complete